MQNFSFLFFLYLYIYIFFFQGTKGGFFSAFLSGGSYQCYRLQLSELSAIGFDTINTIDTINSIDPIDPIDTNGNSIDSIERNESIDSYLRQYLQYRAYLQEPSVMVLDAIDATDTITDSCLDVQTPGTTLAPPSVPRGSLNQPCARLESPRI